LESLLGPAPGAALEASLVPDLSSAPLDFSAPLVVALASLVDPDPPSFADDRDAAVRRALLARSFFAQPEPLKTIDGVLKPFFIVPSAPHAGQNRGPASSRPWRTSVRWRHAEQT
jgi:hypothetical protein